MLKECLNAISYDPEIAQIYAKIGIILLLIKKLLITFAFAISIQGKSGLDGSTADDKGL
jgi:hypothetical protein